MGWSLAIAAFALSMRLVDYIAIAWALAWFGASGFIWRVLAHLPLARKPRIVVTACSLIAVTVLCGMMALSQSREEQQGRVESAKQAEIQEANQGMLKEILRNQLRGTFPAVREISPLMSERSPDRFTSVVSGDFVEATVKNIYVKLRVGSVSPRQWVFLISEIRVGAGFNAAHVRLAVVPGQPVGLISGKDCTLVASVTNVGPHSAVPWVGLVPVKEAPRTQLYSVGDLQLCPDTG
jgi:hypothetical protein